METTIDVQCRAEHAYPGRPVRFTWEGHTYTVAEVRATWRKPEAYGFRVTAAGQIFDLAYLPYADRWVLRQMLSTES